MTLQEEITRRRTFAVIAHPDAGKTTLTEKLLLFGGAIHVAGAVKSNKIKKGATSDFMEIERQRGISVATAVMGFEYKGTKINILDTPGHEDFAEDTYRTLTAVDSVIIVIDGAKGVESQTRKLMEVCRMRSTPVIVFINKLDRPSKEPFDLLDEVEKELRIRVRPLAFPISNGPTFKGVYNLYEKNLSLFTSDEKLTADAQTAEISDLASPELDSYIGGKFAEQLRSDVELVEGVYDEFDREAYLRGELAPVFFGSAVNNFGVRELLECFVRIFFFNVTATTFIFSGDFSICLLYALPILSRRRWSLRPKRTPWATSSSNCTRNLRRSRKRSPRKLRPPSRRRAPKPSPSRRLSPSTSPSRSRCRINSARKSRPPGRRSSPRRSRSARRKSRR